MYFPPTLAPMGASSTSGRSVAFRAGTVSSIRMLLHLLLTTSDVPLLATRLDAYSSSIIRCMGYSEIFHGGAGVFEREAECGCWVQVTRHEDGSILELHVQVCEAHMDNAFSDIELRQAGNAAQLTIPLPSPEDGRREESQ